MTLNIYHKKRNFKSTPEPYGDEPIKHKNLYVIQKHAASHLHYDFRLQMDGVLKSWAVPKGPSLDPHIKRLAVQVEDHPVEYGSFEGTIPQGHYGAGTVMLWDLGTWIPQDKSILEAYQAGNLTFLIQGKKLHGLWKLIRIKSTPKNWLLFKIEDEYAKPEEKYSITEKEELSVISDKSMDEITAHTIKKAPAHRKAAAPHKKAPAHKEAAAPHKKAAAPKRKKAVTKKASPKKKKTAKKISKTRK